MVLAQAAAGEYCMAAAAVAHVASRHQQQTLQSKRTSPSWSWDCAGLDKPAAAQCRRRPIDGAWWWSLLQLSCPKRAGIDSYLELTHTKRPMLLQWRCRQFAKQFTRNLRACNSLVWGMAESRSFVRGCERLGPGLCSAFHDTLSSSTPRAVGSLSAKLGGGWG